MTKIDRHSLSYNRLPLWQVVSERQYRELPYPARRLARRLGCDPSVARLVCEHAGIGGDR